MLVEAPVKKRGKKKRSPLKRFISFFLVIILAAGAVWYSLNYDRISLKSIRRYLDGLFGDGVEAADEIRFDVYSDNIFAWINGGLAVVSSAGMQLLDSGGDIIGKETVIMQKPAIISGSDYAAVWNIGGKDFYVLSGDDGIEKQETGEPIINVSINEDDWMAVSAGESDYRGAVTVYNKKLDPVYKWYSGEGYLISADISDTSDKMAALTMSGSGSRVLCYSFSTQDLQGSFTPENGVIFDLAYLGPFGICALTENSAFFLNDKAELKSTYDYSDGYLKDYTLEGSGFAALVIGKYKTGNSGVIVTLSPDGSVLGSLDINSEVLSVSARGKFLAVLYDDELVVYRSDMTEYARIEDAGNIRQAIVRSDGSVVIISSLSAAIYTP